MKKIDLLFPELCNIYAETYSIDYLARCNEEIDVYRSSHKDPPRFATEPVDMIYLGCSSEKKQEKIIELLRPYRERLWELIESGCVFLITGNAIEIFGQYIRDTEREIQALGLFDFYAERYMSRDRHNSQYVGEFWGNDDSRFTLLGHRSQFSFAYGNFNEPFTTVDIGIGMNPGTKAEGIQHKEFHATYSLGPYLIMNPLFAKYLLRRLGLEDSLLFEENVIEAYEYRRKELIQNLGGSNRG